MVSPTVPLTLTSGGRENGVDDCGVYDVMILRESLEVLSVRDLIVGNLVGCG